jgi:hypothetical protein
VLGTDGIDGDAIRWQVDARLAVHEALGVSVVVRIDGALLVGCNLDIPAGEHLLGGQGCSTLREWCKIAL